MEMRNGSPVASMVSWPQEQAAWRVGMGGVRGLIGARSPPGDSSVPRRNRDGSGTHSEGVGPTSGCRRSLRAAMAALASFTRDTDLDDQNGKLVSPLDLIDEAANGVTFPPEPFTKIFSSAG